MTITPWLKRFNNISNSTMPQNGKNAKRKWRAAPKKQDGTMTEMGGIGTGGREVAPSCFRRDKNQIRLVRATERPGFGGCPLFPPSQKRALT
jgi:hypothetical protein